jgi:tetratricopeptide (TPR) repeat protein
VKGFIVALSLCSGLLACLPLAAAQAETAQTTPAAPAPSIQDAPTAALFQFSLAKLLAVEGSVPEALAAFEEAERLAPQAPYVRIEHAQLLARVGEFSRAPGSRQEYLRRAAAKAEEARQLAPENLDVLRTAGSIYLDLAAVEPSAQATAITTLEEVRRRDPADVPASLSLGQVYLEHKEPEKAIQVLRDLVTRVPQQRVAYALLVEALLRADRGNEAEAALKEVLAFDPASLESRLALVEMQSDRGDHEAALATLRAAPEEVRDDPRVRRKLAWELYSTGDLETALTTVDAMLASDSVNQLEVPSLRLLKGLVLSAEGRNAEAVELLQALHEAQPSNTPLAVTVARLLQRDGKVREGTEILSAAAAELARQGNVAEERELRLELAELQLAGKDWSGVETSVAPLLKSDDEATRLQALVLQGDALMQAKRYDEALKALAGGGSSPAVEARRAEVMLRAGREQEGRESLAALASRNDATAALAAAQAWQRLDRYGESIPLLEKVIAAQPDSVVAHFMLGAAYERSGQRQKGVASLRKVLEIQPDFPAALNYLGYTYAEAGENLDEALRLVRRAVALDPDNGSYVDSLGWTYYRLGRHEQARGYLERAARLEPTDATLHEHLGDVYVALGQNDRAREAYRRALELGDENADNADKVRRKLDDLERNRDRPRG